MIARGVMTQRGDPRVEPRLAVSRNKATRERVLSDLHSVADLLERSADSDDRALASTVRAGLQRAEGGGVVERDSLSLREKGIDREG